MFHGVVVALIRVVRTITVLELDLKLLLPKGKFLGLTFFIYNVRGPSVLRHVCIFLFPTKRSLVYVLRAKLSNKGSDATTNFLSRLRVGAMNLTPNVGMDSLIVGEVTTTSPRDLRSHMVVLKGAKTNVPNRLSNNSTIFYPNRYGDFGVARALTTSKGAMFRRVFSRVHERVRFVVRGGSLLRFYEHRYFNRVLLYSVRGLASLFILLGFSSPIEDRARGMVDKT